VVPARTACRIPCPVIFDKRASVQPVTPFLVGDSRSPTPKMASAQINRRDLRSHHGASRDACVFPRNKSWRGLSRFQTFALTSIPVATMRGPLARPGRALGAFPSSSSVVPGPIAYRSRMPRQHFPEPERLPKYAADLFATARQMIFSVSSRLSLRRRCAYRLTKEIRWGMT